MPERRSRCTIETETPHDWIDYLDDAHAAVEEFAAWLKSTAPFVRDHFAGEYDGLREAAAYGKIIHGEPETVTRIKPLRKRPEMWELRWTILTKEVRQYHGEPASDPSYLVALNLHMKPARNVAHAIAKVMQDKQIAFAGKRYTSGAAKKWQ